MNENFLFGVLIFSSYLCKRKLKENKNMKKIFKYMAILLISIISFSSCVHTIGKEKPMVIVNEYKINDNRGLSEYTVKAYGHIAKGNDIYFKFVEDSDMFEVGDTVKFAKVR